MTVSQTVSHILQVSHRLDTLYTLRLRLRSFALVKLSETHDHAVYRKYVGANRTRVPGFSTIASRTVRRVLLLVDVFQFKGGKCAVEVRRRRLCKITNHTQSRYQ